MCTKPFSWTKNKGKLCLVAKSSGPLLAGLPLNIYNSLIALIFHTVLLPGDKLPRQIGMQF